MPKDIKREFLAGPGKFDDIVEQLGITINEMMAHDGPVPMDLGNVGTHKAKMTQSDSDTSNDVSYDDVCAIAWKVYKAGKGTDKKRPNGPGGIMEKELMNGRVAEGMTEARKEARRAPSTANLIGAVTGTKEAMETKAKARVKLDTATMAESKGISE